MTPIQALMDSASHEFLAPNQVGAPSPQVGERGTVVPAVNPESLASLMRHASEVSLAGDMDDYRPGRFLRAPGPSASPSQRRWRRTGLRLILGLFFVWGLAFNVSEVRGSSMEPGIHDRDHVMVDHVTFRLAGLDRGDIVVLQYPLDPSLDYVTGAWIGPRVDAMDLLLELSNEDTDIVPAFGRVMTRAELRAERDMMEVLRERTILLAREGQSPRDMLDLGLMDGLPRIWDDPYKFLFDNYEGLRAHQSEIGANIL